MEAEARFAHLKELAGTIPDFGSANAFNNSPTVYEWLGRLHALLDDNVFGISAIQVQVAADGLGTTLHTRNVNTLKNALYRAIARIELELPSSSRGAFIPAGNAFDAITATAKILGEAKKDLLIIDPYLGPKVLEVFAVQADEGVQVNLLGAKGRVRSSFEPVAKAWVEQYGSARPISVRYADAKLLHDRLIIVDAATVWDVSQSFEDLAARSPATLSKALADAANLKIEAYRGIFDNAETPF